MSSNNINKQVANSEINRYSGYYTSRKAFSPLRIAECVDAYHMVENYQQLNTW